MIPILLYLYTYYTKHYLKLIYIRIVIKDANKFTLLHFTMFNIRFTLLSSEAHHYDAVKYHRSNKQPICVWEPTGRMVSLSFLHLHNVNSTYINKCAVTSSLHPNTI